MTAVPPPEPTEPVSAEPVSAEPEPTERPSVEPTSAEPAAEPDPAAVAERAKRADRATRGGLAALLCLEAFVVLLVPRAIAQTSAGLTDTKTGLLLALAVVLIGCGFLLRRPWGVAVGSVMQLVVAATIVLIPPIAIVVIFFLLIWWYLLRTRHQLVGTPSGWRMLVS